MSLVKFKFIVILLLITNLSFGQDINPEFESLFNKGKELLGTNPDSAMIIFNQIVVLSKKKNDKKSEALACGKIGLTYYYLGNIDSSIYYWNVSAEKALKIKDYHQAGDMYNNLSIQYLYMQQYDKSYRYIQKAYDTYSIIPDSSGIFECYNNFGTYYLQTDSFDKALENYKTGLSIAEKRKDTLSIATSHTNIAVVYSSMGNNEYTLKENIIAAQYLEKIKNYHNLALCYGNIGALYLDLNQVENAKKYLLDATNIIDTIFFEDYYYNIILVNLGIVFDMMNDPADAEKYFYKALEISKRTKDTKGKVSVYLNLSQVYIDEDQTEKALSFAMKSLKLSERIQSEQYLASSNKMIGLIYNAMNKPQKAIKHFIKAYDISIKSSNLTYILDILNGLKKSYQNTGNYKQAFLTDEKIIFYTDSLSGVESKKQIASLNTIYNIEKKEQQIKEQNLEIDKQNAENKAKDLKIRQGNIITTTVAIVLILVLGLAFILFKLFTQKKKANVILAAQKEEIENKNEELHQQNEEILTQRDKIQEQKELIENIYNEVLQSINYATRLQQSILPNPKILMTHFSDSFVFFQPKDKVSGDFYWWAEVEKQMIITVADCTGHGVPGAFMSMLGVSFLREIVQKEYLTHPGIILRKLRKEVINALKQKGESGEQKDGMDMALVSIDYENNKLVFAGANNPLYIIKRKKLNVENDKIVEITNLTFNDQNSKFFYEVKADKMPIAIYERMDKFTANEIDIQKGDQLYMFSDGFADQFGGPDNKKFKYKPFKQLLLDNAEKSMQEQREIIAKTFAEWKSGNDQVDDILVLGLKI